MGALFLACFLPCTSRSRGKYLRRLVCLRSHELRAYCNFESKRAISITLFGRRPIKKNVRKHYIGDGDFRKHPISGVHKMTTSALAHVLNDAFRSSAILKDVLKYCDLLFSLVTSF